MDAEIDRQVDEGILEPVQFSEWATPIVPVMKPNGSVRLCGDYKLTVNQEAMVDTYTLPRIEDIRASLAGGKFFSKLDLSHAYQQIPLDENQRNVLCYCQHPERSPQDQQATIWCVISSIHVPMYHGGHPTWHTCSVRLHR